MSKVLSRRSLLKSAAAGVAGLAGINSLGAGSSNADGNSLLTTRSILPGLATDGFPGDPTTLRGWAERFGFSIGTSNLVNYWSSPPVQDEIFAIQKREYNIASIDMGWGKVVPVHAPAQRPQDLFSLDNYAGIWWQLQRAVSGNMKAHGYSVYWPGYVPVALTTQAFSRNALINIVHQRLIDLGAIGANLVDDLTVVSEAYTNGDPLQAIIGDDYVEIMFEFAREAFPSTALIYTDYANNSVSGPASSRLQFTQSIVKRLQSKHLIDKVGMETITWCPEAPSKKDMIAAIRSYGLPVMVTECSVNIGRVQGTQDQRFGIQADTYKALLEAALESGVCNEFATWRVGDKYNEWQIDPTLPGASPDNNPTLFDDDLRPKPAYFAVLQVLRAAAMRR